MLYGTPDPTAFDRIDGLDNIAKFLGVSRSTFYAKVLPGLKSACIIFERKKPGGGKGRSFTYKGLLILYLIMATDRGIEI